MLTIADAVELKFWHAPPGRTRCGHLVLWIDLGAGMTEQHLEDTIHGEVAFLATETCAGCGRRIERVECGVFGPEGLTVEEPRLLEVPEPGEVTIG
jgi:hypothetical protein